MDAEIGATLRNARNRRNIDLAEVEAATKIRLRHLRAMENEEWEVLPGGVYTRSFLRTYAAYLGLDGERVADDYRRGPGAGTAEGSASDRLPRSSPGPWRLPSGRFWVAVVSLGLVAALLVIGLTSGEREDVPGNTGPKKPEGVAAPTVDSSSKRSRQGVSVRLIATAEVWVCLLAADGQALVDGEVLSAGAEEGPFRSKGFTVTFGNGEVAMQVNGEAASIPSTASPVGYEIEPDGALSALAESERPTCT